MAEPTVITENAPTAQPAPAPVAAPTPAVQTTPAVAPAPAPLPTDTRERTREQFEKLLESNRRLFNENELMRREIDQRRESNRIFSPVTNTPPAPAQPGSSQVNPNDFVTVDPITGEKYIDDSRLRARIEEINQRTTKAEQALQHYVKSFEEREIERQNTEAFQVYPELEPTNKDKFDPGFHNLVRGVLYDSMVNADTYGYSRPLTFKEAADFVAAQTKRTAAAPAPAPVDTAKQDEERKKAEDAARQLKEQSSAQVNSQPRAQQTMSDDEELERLRYKTRYLGDDEALAKRIMHTEHILPRDATES